MNTRAAFGLVLVAFAAGLVLYVKAAPQESQTPATDANTADAAAPSLFDDVMTAAANAAATVRQWTTPGKGAAYAAAFDAAEVANGLPAGMLSRIAYQESRYNPAARSPAGALGLMQFMPATAAGFGIDPLDPHASIDAAGRYMKSLYAQFGTWEKALAAYNWGQGNVMRKGIDAAPTETKNYFSQILADLGIST